MTVMSPVDPADGRRSCREPAISRRAVRLGRAKRTAHPVAAAVLAATLLAALVGTGGPALARPRDTHGDRDRVRAEEAQTASNINALIDSLSDPGSAIDELIANMDAASRDARARVKEALVEDRRAAKLQDSTRASVASSGSTNSPTDRTSVGTIRASSAARAGAIARGEAGWKTKPT